MQTIGKKEWLDNISFKDAHDIVINWTIRVRQKNVLNKIEPKIVYNYIIDGSFQFFSLYSTISQVFKFSQKDAPLTNTVRNKALHVLSGALKTHFLFFDKENILFEPYIFMIPSLTNAEPIIGIVYQLKDNKYIISCEKDLSLFLAEKEAKDIIQYNTVLGVDSFKWYHLKIWSKLKDEIEGFESFFQKKIQHAKNLEELHKLGTVISVPLDIKDLIKPTGISWNPILRTWFVPKGYDVQSIVEFVEHIENENKKKQN